MVSIYLKLLVIKHFDHLKNTFVVVSYRIAVSQVFPLLQVEVGGNLLCGRT